jgi:hypothetical protein
MLLVRMGKYDKLLGSPQSCLHQHESSTGFTQQPALTNIITRPVRGGESYLNRG